MALARIDVRHRPARRPSSTPDLLPGDRASDRELIWRAGFRLPPPALVRGVVQRAEGAVVLVARAAACPCRLRAAVAVACGCGRVRSRLNSVPRARHLGDSKLVGLAVW